MDFRAGLPGVALLAGMLVSIMAVAWSVRSSTDSARRVLGAAALRVPVHSVEVCSKWVLPVLILNNHPAVGVGHRDQVVV